MPLPGSPSERRSRPVLSLQGIPTVGLPPTEGVGLFGVVGALVAGRIEIGRAERKRERDLETRTNFVASSAHRTERQNPMQAEATLVALSELSDRWRIGSLTDDRYGEMLDALLIELPVRARTQSYYADFLANGSRAELTTEVQARIPIAPTVTEDMPGQQRDR